MSIKVFIINGAAGVGKDTFVQLCEPEFNKNGYTILNISTVDKVKEALKLLGWDGVTKDAKTRKALSDLKDLSTLYNDGPANYVYSIIEAEYTNKYENYLYTEIHSTAIFVHCREPHEIEKMKVELTSRDYNVQTIHMCRSGVESFTNHADANTNNYEYDTYIDNNADLLYLQYLAENFVFVNG